MKFNLEDYVQREHNFAIVDEVDSILIDEARTPLIISGASEESTDTYYVVDRVIPRLKLEEHYTIDEKLRTVALTEEGVTKVGAAARHRQPLRPAQHPAAASRQPGAARRTRCSSATSITWSRTARW